MGTDILDLTKTEAFEFQKGQAERFQVLAGGLTVAVGGTALAALAPEALAGITALSLRFTPQLITAGAVVSGVSTTAGPRALPAAQAAANRVLPTIQAVQGRLQQYLSQAVAQFTKVGYTAGQARAIAGNPGLAAPFRGERIHTFFFQLVAQDAKLMQFLQLTPRFVTGPDVQFTSQGVAFEVSTFAQIAPHVQRYGSTFGQLIFLIY